VSAIEDTVCEEIGLLPISDDLKQILISSIQNRAKAGELKYGVTLERDDLTEAEWLTHLQEELLDALNYATRIQAISPDHKEEQLFGELKSALLFFAVQMQKVIELEKMFQDDETDLHA
jgi:hypothetical protein